MIGFNYNLSKKMKNYENNLKYKIIWLTSIQLKLYKPNMAN